MVKYRYKLVIEYDGQFFCGWQRQDHVVTVQGVLEEAIQNFCGEHVVVFGSGRTDTGVHALGQVAHIDLPKEYEERTVVKAINFYLKPHAVQIVSALKVPETFHARFSASERGYRYRIFMRESASPLLKHYAWHVPFELDVEKMKQEAKSFEGKHDFSSVRAAGCQSNSALKTLNSFDVVQTGAHDILCDIRAKSFLYHQVRNMVGSLVYLCSDHKNKGLKYKSIEELLLMKDRSKGAITAPSSGLYFMEVFYLEDSSQW